MRITSTLIAAAASGILMGAVGCASTPQAQDPSGSTAEAAKHSCKGQNACKGQGGCKTDGHACKGQNACKGQGGCKG
jgi:hypothetical protein